MKKKAKIILFAGVLVILLTVLAVTKRKPADGQPLGGVPAPEQQANVREEWKNYDNRNDILRDDDLSGLGEEDSLSGAEGDLSEMDMDALCRYPQPSYVSEKEDTLIYRKGIYVRIGFQKEQPAEAANDTIIIEGKKYVVAQ